MFKIPIWMCWVQFRCGRASERYWLRSESEIEVKLMSLLSEFADERSYSWEVSEASDRQTLLARACLFLCACSLGNVLSQASFFFQFSDLANLFGVNAAMKQSCDCRDTNSMIPLFFWQFGFGKEFFSRSLAILFLPRGSSRKHRDPSCLKYLLGIWNWAWQFGLRQRM